MRYFFVTGLGRSGSAFLAFLLNDDPNARVEHEPFSEDYLYLPLGYHGGSRTCVRDYIRRRRQRIEESVRGSVPIYGEVNSLVRYFTDELREVFDDPPLMFVVRSGRRYVESAYIRNVYTEESLHAHIVPKDDDPWVESWCDFDRFEKLCWYWHHTNSYLADRLEHFVRFEDILRDYRTLHESVLSRTGVVVSEETHRREVLRPRNTSAEFARQRFGGRLRSLLKPPSPPRERRFGEWTAAREASFEKICGATMRRLGYQ